MKVVILYNPNSTGDSESNAKELVRQLKQKGVSATTRGTTHAGHGEEIAADYAKSGEPIVLISSSGDGGYHEVVNGALAHTASRLVVGVLPSGNANDHHGALGSGKLAEAIANNDSIDIDTIKITATVDGKPWTRYAHSYAGLGVSAVAAKRLTEDRPNIITEKWIVAKSLFSFRYTRLYEQGKKKRYSSLIFSNIDTMSKVMKVSDESSVTDGKFEISGIRFHSKLRLIAYLLTAATFGLKHAVAVRRFDCQVIDATPIQLDGEVYTIDAGSNLTVKAVQQNLSCVL